MLWPRSKWLLASLLLVGAVASEEGFCGGLAGGGEEEEEAEASSLLALRQGDGRAVAARDGGGDGRKEDDICQTEGGICNFDTERCCSGLVCETPPAGFRWRGRCRPLSPAPTPARAAPPASSCEGKGLFVVVVDCGSTSTRAYVYAVDPETLVASQVDPDTEFEAGGLSAFQDDPVPAGKAVRALVEQTYPLVPPKKRSSTQLFVYATAGMRQLPARSNTAIWLSVRRALKSTEYLFQPQQAKTISGNMEGAYAWIAAQQLLRSPGGNAADYTGILEMGGASLQASFAPVKGLEMIMSDEMAFDYKPPDKDIEQVSIFSKSYLGFGKDMAFQRLCEKLYEQGGNRSITSNPCLLQGYVRENVTLYRYTEDEINVTFVGTGDTTECSHEVLGLLHLDYECIQKPCGIMGKYFPSPARKKFVGISNFYYTASGLKLVNDTTTTASLCSINSTTKAFCSMTLEQAGVAFPLDPGTTFDDFQWENCFAGTLQYFVLKAVGFETGLEIEYVYKINGQKVTWTQGAALYETFGNVLGHATMS